MTLTSAADRTQVPRNRRRLAVTIVALIFSAAAAGCSRAPSAGAETAVSRDFDAARSAAPGAVPLQAAPAKHKASRWSHVDTAVTPGADDARPANVEPPKVTKDGYRNLDWLELMPKAEADALAHPDRSTPIDHTSNTRAAQSGSFHVVADLDGEKARLEGYVVPIEADDEGNMTEFFIVPFFGACIHVPPPPPNQIIYAKLAKGIKTPEFSQAFWFKGTLRTRTVSNRVAGAAYSMENPTLVPWDG